MGDVGYGGCKQRIKGIDKCKERFCTVLRIIKIIKKGGECRCRGLDLTQTISRWRKRQKKEDKK